MVCRHCTHNYLNKYQTNVYDYKVNCEQGRFFLQLILSKPISLKLQDGIVRYQVVAFDYNNRVGPVSFSAAKLCKGNSFNDTCLAELNLSESTTYVFGEIDE